MSDSDKKEETGDAQDNACGRRRLLSITQKSCTPKGMIAGELWGVVYSTSSLKTV